MTKPLAALLLLTAACGPSTLDKHPPLGGVRKDLVMTGLSTFREAFNRGDCQSIYDNATLEFRQLEPLRHWLDECDLLRNRLASWTDFRLRTAEASSGFQARVEGTAVFTHGTCRLKTTWNLEDGQARLFSLYLEDDHMLLILPPRQPI